MRLFPAFLAFPVIAAIGVALDACFVGGQPATDAGPTSDAANDTLASDASDAGAEATCEPTDAGDATWTSLYADLFGPASIGQCGAASRTSTNGTSQTSCHHDSTGSGAVSSGFICGDTQESCYQGITSPNAKFVGQQVVVPCSPDNSYLMQVLRHDGGGLMPFYPENAVFSDADMARVRAWIAAGAPDN